MSTTVTYKDNTLITVNNATKTLKTAGKYMEDDVILTDMNSGGGDTYTLTTIVPQQTFTVSSSNHQAILTSTGGFEDGEMYLITFDSAEYTSSCRVLWSANYCIGDINPFMDNYTTDNVFPVGLIWEDSVMHVATKDTNQHTVKVEHLEFVDGPLNLIAKSVTVNGTYTASSDNADGYSSVTVNVAGGGSATYRLDNIVPEQTVACTTLLQNNAYFGFIQNGTPVDQTELYVVTFDGTQYVCKGYIPEANTSGVGDIRVTQTNAAQYLVTPFFIEYENASGNYYFVVRGSGTHTVKIDKLTFIDDGETFTTKTITQNGTYNASSDNADGYSSVTVNVSSNTLEETWETVFDDDITISNKEVSISELANLYFQIGDTWRVTLDNTEYLCEVGYYDVADVNYIGNIDLADGVDEGGEMPFCFYNLGWANALSGDMRTNGSHSLKLEKLVVGSSTNPLSGKIAVFTGDSICEGYGYAGGYAGIIGTENNMTIQNLGVGDGCVAPYSDANGARFVISTSIANMRSDADYVILEGGCNDAGYEVPLGTLTSGYNDTLNTNTFAGAFEYMLKSAIAKFPDAKIGYIFVHKCEPNFDSRTTNSYYNVAKAACEKWGIPYCDLNTQIPPLGYVNDLQTTYLVDPFHPNELGYRTFYVPKITAFMQTMLVDVRTTAKTVDTNGTYLASNDSVDGYSSVTVNVPSGSSSPDIPTFTTDASETVVTCDKTYAECLALIHGGDRRAFADIGGVIQGVVTAHTLQGTTGETLRYYYIHDGVPSACVTYANNGTLTLTHAPDSVQSLNVTQNGTYNASGNVWDEVIVNVSSGSSMNVQTAQSTMQVASTTYTKTASLTCAVSGTYDVYWDCFRSNTSGTNGSQLYIGGSAYGSPNTTFDSNIHVQSNHLTGVTLAANQEVAIYVRSHATNYYAYCGQLTIVQTA